MRRSTPPLGEPFQIAASPDSKRQYCYASQIAATTVIVAASRRNVGSRVLWAEMGMRMRLPPDGADATSSSQRAHPESVTLGDFPNVFCGKLEPARGLEPRTC